MIVKRLLKWLLGIVLVSRFGKWFWNFAVQWVRMKPILENDILFAVWHPQANYEFHILILPKQAIRDFSEMETYSAFWSSLPEAVATLVKQFKLDDKGYRLITNCGTFQEIPQLHFHLVAGSAK